MEQKVLDYLNSKKVLTQFVKDSNHSALGIIDRLTRTLRDLNAPSVKSKSQSHAEKYRVFTEAKMTKLIDLYNNSLHSSIKCTPKEMFNDPKIEEEYIFQMLTKAEEQRKNKDFELDIGTYVRFILPRSDGISKKRYRVSPEMYLIDSKRGNHYNLMSKDGNVITKPRYLLIPVDKDERVKFAETIPGRNTGVIDRIIGDVSKNKVKVLFRLPNGEFYEDIIPKSFLK
jgi:hypothetical protein